MSSRGDAERATKATLETLGERLVGGAANNLASQLPPLIGDYLRSGADMEIAEMTLDDFFRRVSEREEVDLPKSIHHARAVVSVLQDAVSEWQIDKVREQFPKEWAPLFDSGSEGRMER